MHLNIKNDEAHRLATELARCTGESLTTAVTIALRERLDRERRRSSRAGIASSLLALAEGFAAQPERDTRSADEILGYDENGLPT